MLLDLLTLAAFLGFVLAGVVVLSRGMLRAPAADQPRCARCDRPANDLTESFICPGCGQDVRLLGLSAPVRDTAMARFWKAMAFTIAVLFVVDFLQPLSRSVAPSIRYEWRDANLHLASDREDIERIEIRLTRKTRSGESPRGSFVADLYLRDGRMSALEMDITSRRTRTIDEVGNVTVFETFDPDTIARWVKASGVDTLKPQVMNAVNGLHQEVEAIFSSGQYRSGLHGTGVFSGGSGSSSGNVPVSWWSNTMLLLMGALWVFGLRWILRERQRGVSRVAEVTP